MLLRDAAQRVGLSHSTLRVQIKNGRLKAVKRGRDWWVSEAQLAAYVRRATQYKERGKRG